VLSVALFLLFCALLVLGGWAFMRRSGGRAFFIDDWVFAPDERVLWRDDQADAVLIPERRQAHLVTFPRLRRTTIIVTNRRIIIGTKALLSARRLVLFVLTSRPPADGQSRQLDGGLFSVGYRALVFDAPGLERHLADPHPFVDLPVSRAESSSVNLRAVRLFTDDTAGFRLPTDEA
jgi:hypothetical protein